MTKSFPCKELAFINTVVCVWHEEDSCFIVGSSVWSSSPFLERQGSPIGKFSSLREAGSHASAPSVCANAVMQVPGADATCMVAGMPPWLSSATT